MKDSLLIHGLAGSGKSTAARKIEQLLWKSYEMNMSETEVIPSIPIFIQLPSLKDPIYSAVEETLKSDNYRFGDRQVENLKEAVQSGKFRIIFIMDSYDELKQQYFGLNVNVSNKLSKWSNSKDKGIYPKVITTSRTEFLNTKQYFRWFISESNNANLFQEVRLINFDNSQINYYIQEYCQLETMKIIREIGVTYDLADFKQQWDYIKENLQIEKLVPKESVKLVQDLIGQQWNPKQYAECIAALQLELLLVTPFMMEIVMVVLPKIIQEKKNINSIKDSFILRYSPNEKESLDAWQSIINNSQFIEEYQKVQTKKQMGQLVHKYFNSNRNYKSLESALILEPLTSFDFYVEFFENYFNRQIQKLKEQGEPSDIKDQLWEFAHKLANEMTSNNLSQVQIKQSGLVFKKQNKDWKDQFFDDDCPEGVYKKLFRKCIPLKQKNGVFSFNHKSFQDFLVAKWFIYRLDNLENEEFFTQQNWNLEYLNETIRFIVDKVKYNEYSQQLLFNMILKTRDNKQLIRAGSNAMFILYQSDYKFINKDLSQIHLMDVNLAGINFFATNLERSIFQNVNLSYSNISKANLIKCKWDSTIINERPVLTKSEEQLQITQLFFLNNSNNLLSVNQSQQIFQWNCQEAKEVQEHCFNNIRAKLMVQSISDNLIALVDQENINIYDTSFNKMIYEIKFSPVFQNISQLKLVFTNGQTSLLICSQNSLFRVDIPNISIIQMEQNIKQIELSNNMLKKLINQSILQLEISETYALLHYESNIWIYDPQKNSFLAENLYTNQEQIYSSSISIDGMMIATGGQNQIINLYQIDKLQFPQYLKGHTKIVTQLQFFSSYKYLVSGSKDEQSIRLWDVQTSIQVHQFQVDYEISKFAVQSGSMLLAVGTYGGIIQLYDMEQSGKINQQIQGHQSRIYCCDSSNNGIILASGCRANTIKFWDLSIGQQIGKDMITQNTPISLGFTIDDQFVFSGEMYGLIIQWDVSTQLLIKQFNNFSDSILDLIAIDSNSIITRSIDQHIKLWNVSKQTYQILTNNKNKQSNIFQYSDGVDNFYTAKYFEIDYQNILTLGDEIITAILTTKDGRFTILGTNIGNLNILEGLIQQSSRVTQWSGKQHTDSITKIIQIDENNVVSAGKDGQIIIRNLIKKKNKY